MGLPTPAKILSHTIMVSAILMAMNPLTSFAILIATAQSLVAAVTTRDDLHIRPLFARKAVAARLVSGLGILRAFLRRLIILIALEMEWGLIDRRGAMKRPHGRKSMSHLKPSLKGLDAHNVSPWLNSNGPAFKTKATTDNRHGHTTPIPIDMTKLYAQLDYLSGIAANPIAKAKRLAFHLARTYQGIIIPPVGPKRIAGRYGTQVSASYDAMHASIITNSRNRPPPLAPPRTHWPTITAV